MAAIGDTPCPTSSAQTHQSFDTSILDFNGDTADLSFTTAFRASFRNVKPRRRQTAVRKSSVAFDIHEDAGADRTNAFSTNATSNTLQRPPQRLGRQVDFVGSGVPHSGLQTHNEVLLSESFDFSNLPGTKSARFSHGGCPAQYGKRSTKPAKVTRRDTVFIPADDTTLPSMHMGVFSPVKRYNTDHSEVRPDLEMTGIAAQMALKRRPRTSLAGNGPKRIPLSATSMVPQTKTIDVDRPGTGGGKENMPPNHTRVFSKSKESPRSVEQSSFCQPSKPNITSQQQLFVPKQSRRILDPVKTKPTPVPSAAKPAWNSGTRQRVSKAVAVPSSSVLPPVHPISTTSSTKPLVPTRFITPSIRVEPVLQHYPILSEDVTHVGLYEDDWLTHQEAAITQLLNGLHSNSSSVSFDSLSSNQRRQEMLSMHSSSTSLLLYKRLQAAIFYGSLSFPHDHADESEKIYRDIGRRKAFVDLWLKTYQIEHLKLALEVVVGRKCVTDEDHGKSAVRFFIEAFLLQNADLKAPNAEDNSNLSPTPRTLMRSLMLIRLLDLAGTKARASGQLLFLPTSSYKSSNSVLQALMKLLNPAAGDPVRALALLNYEINHLQSRLQEVDYTINNLAVDLRDGTRLVRLVEILLYPSAAPKLAQTLDFEATTTIMLPDGETVDVDTQADWPLSQHLTFPCLGRATMMYNVQLALSALHGIGGMENIVADIKAKDIVDGYREKTLKLLWALTGKWGLPGLVDWHDVTVETRRLRWLSQCVDDSDEDDLHDDEQLSFGKCKGLLKAWAKAAAAAQGLHLQNFTTSFSDGKAFSAIVDTYWPYFSFENLQSDDCALAHRLTKLGCNYQFASLFRVDRHSRNQGHYFDRDFVLSALAFLCSRLLGPSRNARAAISIQRAWRTHWKRVLAERQVQTRLVAHGCAEAVSKKNKIRAGKVIWSAWKLYRVQKTKAQVEEDNDIWLSL